MNINPINTTMLAVQAMQPVFSGTVITKGQWPQELHDAFLQSQGIKDLAEGDRIVIGSLKTKKKRRYSTAPKESFYKLYLEIKNKPETFAEKLKSALGLSTFAANKHYHSERGMESILETRDKQSFLYYK